MANRQLTSYLLRTPLQSREEIALQAQSVHQLLWHFTAALRTLIETDSALGVVYSLDDHSHDLSLD
jgi:uncharacterized damage-inducible protein DinB